MKAQRRPLQWAACPPSLTAAVRRASGRRTTTRDRLHRFLDVLPDAVLADAERVLVALVLAARVPADVRARLAAELDAPRA